MTTFRSGDKVIAARDIWQDADEDHPRSLLASRGDELTIVRENSIESDSQWPVTVRHDWAGDRSFGVNLDEIRPAQ